MRVRKYHILDLDEGGYLLPWIGNFDEDVVLDLYFGHRVYQHEDIIRAITPVEYRAELVFAYVPIEPWSDEELVISEEWLKEAPQGYAYAGYASEHDHYARYEARQQRGRDILNARQRARQEQAHHQRRKREQDIRKAIEKATGKSYRELCRDIHASDLVALRRAHGG